MPSPLQTEPPVLTDLAAYATGRARGFTGREWALGLIDAWLGDPNGPRFLLITGEPGSGKTALAAQLYRFARGDEAPPAGLTRLGPKFLSAAHFCQASDSSRISPLEFAESLSLQLANRYPLFTEALVDKDSSGQVVLRTEQRVDENTGQVVGIYVNHLHLGRLQPEDAFLRAVREPLEALVGRDGASQIVILVDALDEALYYSGRVKIPSLLLEAQHLPPGVRFVVTSRPSDEALEKLRRLKPAPLETSLSEGEGLAWSKRDVGDYLRRAVGAAGRIELAADLSQDTLAETLQERSEGNFLYVGHLLTMLADRKRPVGLSDLDGLPVGLDAVYVEFLERLAEPQEEAWSTRYAPVLGTLSVAREALVELQLAGIVGLAADEIARVMTPLGQFLDDARVEGSYRLYHRSFADFLLEPEIAREGGRERNRFWCMAARQHERIAAWYLKTSPGTWPAYAARYGLRHLAGHLVQAVEGWDSAHPADPAGRLALTERLVGVVTDPAFQELYQTTVGDVPAFKRDLMDTLETTLRLLSRDDAPQRLVPLVRSALGLPRFDRAWVQPQPLFAAAREGKLETAEYQLPLFSPEADWYQAIVLTLAWLAADTNPDEARALRDKVAPHLLDQEPLSLLLSRVDASLAAAPPATMPAMRALPPPPSGEEMRAVLQRLGGADVDQELLQSFLGPPPAGELMGNVDYLAQEDGEKLVAFALDHPEEGDAYLQQYLDLHTSYVYEDYRNRSLWILLGWVLCHPDGGWARTWTARLAETALLGSTPQFREALGLTVLGLQARAGVPKASERLNAIRDGAVATVAESVTAAESSGMRGQGDSWGFLRRRLALLAEVYGLLLDQPVFDLLDQALLPLGGFAGFQAPALLTLPEAVQVAEPGAQALIDRALAAALEAAHNIQDSHFCAITTARVHAARLRWWPGPVDPKAVVERFVADPTAPDFAALHIVGESYEGRTRGPHKLELDPRVVGADTLAALAEVYQRASLVRAHGRPLDELQRLNPPWAADEPLPVGAEINIPDPGFTALLASRLSAAVLSAAELSRPEKVRLVGALVPQSLANPTALDTVLARLLLAARPDDVDLLEALAEVE